MTHQNLQRVFSLIAILAVLPGCAMNGDSVALEKQLRAQETTIRQLSSKLQESERLLADQDRELLALRNPESSGVSFASATNAGEDAAAEVAAAFGSVVSVAFHQLTCGLADAQGPNPSLNLVLQPLDSEGELVKVAGELAIRVSMQREGDVPVEVMTEKFTVTDSRRLWSRGLVSSGFHLQLPLTSRQLSQVRQMPNGHLIAEATLDLGALRRYEAAVEISTGKSEEHGRASVPSGVPSGI